MKLSPAQWIALAHLARHDAPAQRLPGGIWTAEPEAWERGERDAISDVWLRTETLESLARRRLVRRTEADTYELTDAGRTRLAIYHYEERDRCKSM